MSEDKLQASISRGARPGAARQRAAAGGVHEARGRLHRGLENLAGGRRRRARAPVAGGQRARQGEGPSHTRRRGRQARATSIERPGSQAAITEDIMDLNNEAGLNTEQSASAQSPIAVAPAPAGDSPMDAREAARS